MGEIDAELAAMLEITRLLDPLPVDAIERVLAWAGDRWLGEAAMQRRKAEEDVKWDEAERQLRAEAEARAQAEQERRLQYEAMELARRKQEEERQQFRRRQKAEAELQDPLIQQALALYYRLGGIPELEKCVGVPGFPHCSTWVNRFVQDHRCWRHTTSDRETAMRVALEFEEGLATIGVPQTWRPGSVLLQLNREQQVVPFEA